eukprot:scaffold70440_cov27-Phaeocystis_antarctica.AAC.1
MGLGAPPWGHQATRASRSHRSSCRRCGSRPTHSPGGLRPRRPGARDAARAAPPAGRAPAGSGRVSRGLRTRGGRRRSARAAAPRPAAPRPLSRPPRRPRLHGVRD